MPASLLKWNPLSTVFFPQQNVYNNLPEGDSDIMLGPLRFALSAQDAFTERENGDGATWG